MQPQKCFPLPVLLLTLTSEVAKAPSPKVTWPKAATMIRGSLIVAVYLLLVGFNNTNAAGTGGDTKIH